jgi:phosphoglycolate phosphatase-like HAD superfamily hydrolase
MAELAEAALLLDLDGTLWDSAAWYPEVIAKACGCQAPEIQEALRHRSVTRVLADFGITKTRFAILCSDLGGTLVVFDRVRDTLASVVARDIATGAVTNLPGWVAQPMLQSTGLAHFLDIVIPYRRAMRPKPWPDTLLDALGRLGVPATAASWYVGDTVDDAQAAQAAGISFAWVGYGIPGPVPADPRRVLSSFSEIEDLFP